MATLNEVTEFEELGEFFRRLRQTCELQGSDFKQQLRDDAALKTKFVRFKSVATKIKEYKKIQKEREKEKAKSSATIEETLNAPLQSIPFSARKSRKRKYNQTIDENHINPRKKWKRSKGNNVGFSPSFGNRNINKPIVDKENIPNITNPQEVKRKPTMCPLSMQKPSARNISHRNRKLLSQRTSLKNRINFKTLEKQKQDEENSKPKANDTKPQTNDVNEKESKPPADIVMNAPNDYAGDVSMDGDDDYEYKCKIKSNRNSAKTPKVKKSRSKTQKKKKAKKVPHTVKPNKKKKKTVRNKKRTSRKSKTAKPKKKKDGDLVSKNFVKIDLKHKNYRRKRGGNRPTKKKKFQKFDKFADMKRQREETLKKNNLNLENLEQLKLEVFTDSDKEDPDLAESTDTKQKEEEDETNQYLDRLNNIQNDDEIDDILHDVLQKEYGYSEYRRGQKEAIKLIMQKHSTLLLLPTGAGKSICYQIPTILWKNKDLKPVTLVISPLRSLMRDQCDNLPKCLRGKVWDSSLTRNDIYILTKQLVAGDINVLFIAPEKLDNNYFQSLLKNTIGSERLMFACIDEAHCISEWSHNFRPSYLKLNRILKEKLHVGCILACTATATIITQHSTCNNLNIDTSHIVNALAKRENLHLTVSHIGRGLNKEQKLFDLLKTERFCDLKSLIVYVCTRKEVASVTSKLKALKRYDGITEVDGYHAGMTNPERARVQEGFMSGSIHIIVATIAFGMGLNKSDVRGVIHYSVPASMEHYVQEVGRAGRDGKGSECHVFYDREDIDRKRSWIYKNGVDLIQIKQLLFDIFSAKNVTVLKNRLKKEKQKTLKKIFQRKRKKKRGEEDFSDEDIDDIEDDLVITEFHQVDDVVVISKNKNTERKYDANEAVLATIFTYLDVYKSEYCVQLPSHNDLVRIGLSTTDIEKESEIMHFIMNCYNPKNGMYLIHLGRLYNDLRHFQIEDEEGEIINIENEYNIYQISKHLKNLEYKKKITLSFDDAAFVLMIKKEIVDHDELVALCNNVFDYISKHEKSDLEKINTMAQALKIMANNNEMDQDEDEKKSICLHELVEKYFECETHDEFLDLVQSYLEEYDHIRTQPVSKSNIVYAEVKLSVIKFMTEYTKITRPRSIAKIFHGFDSPRYDYRELYANPYNKKHMNFPFMQIMEIVKEVMEEKKEKRKKMESNEKMKRKKTNDEGDDDDDDEDEDGDSDQI